MKNLRPLRVVLATVGSRGDVQPMLALAQELVARGHHPVIAVPPDFDPWVTGLGFEFAALGVDIQAFLASNRDMLTGQPVRMIREAIGFLHGQWPLQARQLLPVAKGADAMVCAGLAISAPAIAEHLRLPILGVQYTDCMLASSRYPPPNIPRRELPRWLNRLLWAGNHVLGDLTLLKPLNQMRAGLGLAPVPHVREYLVSDIPVVIAADKGLLPPDPAWQHRYPFANFLFFDDPSPLDEELSAWLNEGEAPVYVGFGSMSGNATQRMPELVVRGISATGRRGLISTGWARLKPEALPPDWRLVTQAPHAALFPRCAAVVHHGGSGTMAQALRAGVPQVVLPLVLDQFHHAHRLHQAGLAPAPHAMEKVTAAQLTESVRAALQLPEGPRKAMSLRLRAADARSDLADRIEAMVASGRVGSTLSDE